MGKGGASGSIGFYDDIEGDVWRVKKPTEFVDAGDGRDRRDAGECCDEDLFDLVRFGGGARGKHGAYIIVLSVSEAS